LAGAVIGGLGGWALSGSPRAAAVALGAVIVLIIGALAGLRWR